MPRAEGFAVMDVSTDVANDPKFRRLQRLYPSLVGDAFTVYISTLAESWKAGQRVPADEVWPAILPYNEAVITALREAGCLDSRNLVAAKAWKSWFGPADARRTKSRDRWRRYNESRETSTKSDDASASLPRGNDADTATSVPFRTVPDRPAPSVPQGTHDPWDDPEHEALVWLAKHGCDVRPGNGYHRKLVTAVEVHGVNPLIGMMDRLAAAGTKHGDIKGFLFGAIDALDKHSRPSLAVLEKGDRADDERRAFQARLERTRSQTAELREVLEQKS